MNKCAKCGCEIPDWPDWDDYSNPVIYCDNCEYKLLMAYEEKLEFMYYHPED